MENNKCLYCNVVLCDNEIVCWDCGQPKVGIVPREQLEYDEGEDADYPPLL